ncbi:protein-disulfide reductase DsbD family protein [Enterovirga aerilata]|uniref:Thiol:disulfide interchange protein n=1 Tax=Enterovirga aerilata TaxID=2730920 RepID=A0A849I5T4_9HYPH|nr:thioredoxin family protein [Enterovirga sp. DB1703]NNM72691.1 thiol:disulfide interchange protein [Enterovirga sp. DB1703]
MKALLSAALVALSLWAGFGHATAAPRAEDLVKAELVAEPSAVRPGEPFTVGVKLTMAPHWHTYWRNPGDSGLATEIRWSLPEGLQAGPIQWPVPQRIPVSHLVNYGYEGETILLTEITPPADLSPSRPLTLKADVSYLVCERECIPGEASLSILLPVAGPSEDGRPDPADKALFDRARAALPTPSPWTARTEISGDKLLFSVEAPGLGPGSIRSAYLFPFDETAIEHAAPQSLSARADGFALEIKRSSLSQGEPAPLGGVLVLEEALDTGTVRHAVEIGAPPKASPAAAAVAPGTPAAAGPGAGTRQPAELTFAGVAQAAFLAFLGGLILNLMPCVFPVLSIKVLSLVKHSGYPPALVRLNGLAYAAGVVGSFLLLAGILLAVRAGGAEVGWGFQLQSPAVVTALAFLLFAMGLSLSGVVELGTSLAGFGQRLDTRTGLPGSFLTGILATVVATPCTAPFMGTAIGFAMTAPAVVALAIFAALGLGLALPFLLLTFWPGLARHLPRPGRWMETLKQFLAFPIYATVAWLLFVLSQEVGPAGLFSALIGLVAVGFAAWALRLAAFREGWSRRAWQGGALAAILALVGLGIAIDRDRVQGSASAAAASGEAWQPFTQARLDQLRAEGRPVFVNMTAAWCITCIVNERTALSTEAVQQAFRSRQVAYLKGDWTNRNPEITRLLEQHGRSGVPLYVFYPPGGEPVVLPQILTQATVIDSLGAAPSKRAGLQSSATRKE